MQIQASTDRVRNSTTKRPLPRSLVEPIIVTKLECDDILRAAKTFQRTFADDPIMRYVRNEREPTREEAMLDRYVFSLQLFLWIHTKRVFTVGGGTANVVCTPPRDDPAQPRMEEPAIDSVKQLFSSLVRYRYSKMTEMEKRRRTEADEKMQDTVVRAFGSRVEKMWLVDNLWTDARSRGGGYGGALLDTVMTMADWAGQSTWLQSSNTANAAFYARHGFQPAAKFVLGEEDPSWHHEPILVNIMVREPRWPPPPLDFRT